MDADTIQAEIQDELKSINNVLQIIQSELDELNSLSKPGGPLDIAVQEGIASAIAVSKQNGMDLELEKKKYLNVQNNRPIDATRNETETLMETNILENDTMNQ